MSITAVSMLVGVGTTAWHYTPPYGGVRSFELITLDDPAPEKPGDMAASYRYIPAGRNFYMFIFQQDLPSPCIFGDCSNDGHIVQCMHGWLSGSGDRSWADGILTDEAVKTGASLIVMSDADARIMGIYPNYTEYDVVTVLKKYPQYKEKLDFCLQNSPEKLKIEVLKEGQGQTAKTGDTAEIRKKGTLADGTEFAPNADWDTPYSFTIGADIYLPGLAEGVLGMKVGEKRRLTIPPHLAYDEQGGDGIPPNSTLIYEVELLKISPSPRDE